MTKQAAFQLQVVRMLGDIKKDATSASTKAEAAVVAAAKATEVVNAKFDALNLRLFEPETGLISIIRREIEKENGLCLAERKELRKKIEGVEKTATYFAGGGAVAGMGLGVTLKWLASKIGLHF